MAESRSGTTYDLSQRVVAIPGGFGDLGRAATLAFAAAGATVIAAGASDHSAALATLRSAADTAGDHIHAAQVNMTVEGEVAAFAQQIVDQHGRLDVLVNLIGGWKAGKPVHELDSATWHSMLDLNLHPAFLLAHYCALPMVRQQWGRIIHVSSRAALTGRRNAAAYAVAKQAVVTLAEAQAEELREAHVTVNAILPSIIDTPANRAGMPRADFSRWPKPEEIARVLLFLASDDAQLISGATIPVYGLA